MKKPELPQLERLSGDELTRLYDKILRTCQRWGLSQDAEDIAQTVILGYLEGRSTHQMIKHSIIDVLRAQQGRKGSRVLSEKKNLRHAMPIKNELLEAPEPDGHIKGFSKIHELDFRKKIEVLAPNEHCMIFLIVVWGFTQSEVADCFGTSESWVCQKLAVIKEKLIE